MRIGIDVDGVLADYNTGFLRTLCRVSGKSTPHQIGQHFLPTIWHWPQSLGFTQGEIDEAIADRNKSPYFWLTLAPYAETQQVLDRLFTMEAEGDDVYFITDRPGYKAKTQTEQWLKYCGLSVRPTVLISSKKCLCAAALDLDYYIDDKADNARLVQAGSKARTYLLTRPWNEGYILHPAIRRVSSPLAMLRDATARVTSSGEPVLQTSGDR